MLNIINIWYCNIFVAGVKLIEVIIQMMVYHLEELIKAKERREQRKIADSKIAEEIGITRQTLARIKDNHIKPYTTNTEILDKLLKYFDCTQINELVDYIP